MVELDVLWNQIKKDLKLIMTEDDFNSTFDKIHAIDFYQNDNAIIKVATSFIQKKINKLYLPQIDILAKKYSEIPIRFKFVTEDDPLIVEIKKEKSPEKKNDFIFNKYRHDVKADFTFSNFVVGKTNNHAFMISSKVADQLGTFANPLYIFGETGLGKTHLMHAIGNYVLDKDGKSKVKYVNSSTFLKDFTKSITNNNNDVFLNEYLECDCLLVDDIQLISGAERTQKEFLLIYEHLYSNNKQIVITSDCPTKKIKGLMERLQSRLSQGMIIEIGSPDLELRINILRKKIKSDYEDVEVSDDVITFLAKNFHSNIRELEGSLRNVIQRCNLLNLSINLENATEILSPQLSSKKITDTLNENNYDRVLSVVADYYHIGVEEILGTKRNKEYVVARHIAMYIIKTKYNLTLNQIGNIFLGKDHTTVKSAIEKIAFEYKQYEDTRIAVSTILAKISAYY